VLQRHPQRPLVSPLQPHPRSPALFGIGSKRPRPSPSASDAAVVATRGNGGAGDPRAGRPQSVEAPPLAPAPPHPHAPPSPYRSHGTHWVALDTVQAASRAGRAAVEALVSSVVSRVVSGEIPFPFKSRCVPVADLPPLFTALRAYPNALRLERRPYALHGYYPGGRVVASPAVVLDAGSRTLAPRATPVSLTATSVTDVAGAGAAAIPFDKEWNETGGLLVDWHAEPARMAAVRRDERKAPLELWRDEGMARRVVEKAVRKFGEVTDFSLRHGMYGHIAGANLFKAHLAHAIYALFAARRVLDMCAGWGDRLTGAMSVSSVVHYAAWDPNPALVAPHGGMVATYRPDAPAGAFSVTSAPFETAVLPDVDGGGAPASSGFDFAFTSPPFFDLEVYEAPPAPATAAAGCASGQSIVTHPSQRAWLERWYMPMLSAAWRAVIPGGHLAIYINDHEGKGEGGDDGSAGGGGEVDTHIDVCAPMLAHMATLPGCHWVGCVGIVGETGKVRPLWVWRKVPPGAPPTPLAALPPLYHLLLGGTGGAGGGGAEALPGGTADGAHAAKRPRYG
jgi:hypothetical protein